MKNRRGKTRGVTVWICLAVLLAVDIVLGIRLMGRNGQGENTGPPGCRAFICHDIGTESRADVHGHAGSPDWLHARDSGGGDYETKFHTVPGRRHDLHGGQSDRPGADAQYA